MTNQTGELITVQSFAIRYRVEASTIRAWIKRKAIPYELVGPRKMRLRPGAVAIPIIPSAIVGSFDVYPLSDNYMRATGINKEAINEQRESSGRQDGVGKGRTEGSGGKRTEKPAGRNPKRP